MKKNKTSILIIGNDGKSKKSIQLNTHIVLYWKQYLISFIAVFLLLGCTIGYIIYDQTSSFYNNKLSFIQNLKIKSEQKKAEQSLQKVDAYVNRINQLLRDKGLYVSHSEHTGGPVADDSDIEALSNDYIERLSFLERSLNESPVGLPHNGYITSHFGYRSNPFSGEGAEVHKGIDFKGGMGEPVKTTAIGKIVHAGPKGGYGNCVIVEHPRGYKTLYAHLSKINVWEGEKVSSGRVIGKVGSTGRSTGPHLHYEVLKNEERVNPEQFLKL